MPAASAPILDAEPTGVPLLPLARVKRIIGVDPDLQNVSQQATFVVTKATELFVKHLAQRSFTQDWDSGLRYRADLPPANAVARADHLEFLVDIAPQTTTWGAHKAKKIREVEGSVPKADSLPAGQTTLDTQRRPRSNPAEISILSDTPSISSLSGPAPPKTNGESWAGTVGADPQGSKPLANGHDSEHGENASDVEMD